jgi:biopolymer transport protein ExbB/TolQ
MKQAFVMIRAGLLIPPVLLLLSLTAVPEWNLWLWLSLVLALGCVGGGLFAANTLQRQQAELEQRTRQLQASEQQLSPAAHLTRNYQDLLNALLPLWSRHRRPHPLRSAARQTGGGHELWRVQPHLR